MFELVIIWLSTFFTFFKKGLQIHNEISGNWYNYIQNIFTIWRYQRTFPKGRLDLHDSYKDTLANYACIPFQEEIKYSHPKEVNF